VIRFGGRVNYVDLVSSFFVGESLQALGGIRISIRRSFVAAGERPDAISPAVAQGGVNLLALSAPGTGRETGTVRLLVPNGGLTARALPKAGDVFSSEDVLFIDLKNRPGALAKAIEKLARTKISVRYAYATASSRTKTTAAVVAVEDGDLPRALKMFG
jgi:hypothetical protein